MKTSLLIFAANVAAFLCTAAAAAPTIDGDASDWQTIAPLTSATGQSTTRLKTQADESYLYFCIQGAGMLPHYDLFINSDNAAATGYRDSAWAASGADFLVENGTLYRSNGTGWSWSVLSGGVTASVNADVAEIRVAKASLGNLASTITVAFRDMDASWNQKSILPANGPFVSFAVTGDSPAPTPTPDPTPSSPMRVLVPAYFEPTSSSWSRVVAQSAKMRGRIGLIANPNSGPGSSVDADYTQGIARMRDAGGLVLGYVATGYGKKSATTVQREIDQWYTWYPAIDGIFFDEQANTSGQEAKYQGYYRYVKGKKASSLVIGNPGTSTLETYLFYQGARVTDVLCTFESDSGFSSWKPSSWCSRYSADNFYTLNLGCPSSSWRGYTDRSAAHNVGWTYSTDRSFNSNPWGALSSYFEAQCAYINSK
jgi:hypothetical protein